MKKIYCLKVVVGKVKKIAIRRRQHQQRPSSDRFRKVKNRKLVFNRENRAKKRGDF